MVHESYINRVVKINNETYQFETDFFLKYKVTIENITDIAKVHFGYNFKSKIFHICLFVWNYDKNMWDFNRQKISKTDPKVSHTLIRLIDEKMDKPNSSFIVTYFNNDGQAFRRKNIFAGWGIQYNRSARYDFLEIYSGISNEDDLLDLFIYVQNSEKDVVLMFFETMLNETSYIRTRF
jgi:hypothetical protein